MGGEGRRRTSQEQEQTLRRRMIILRRVVSNSAGRSHAQPGGAPPRYFGLGLDFAASTFVVSERHLGAAHSQLGRRPGTLLRSAALCSFGPWGGVRAAFGPAPRKTPLVPRFCFGRAARRRCLCQVASLGRRRLPDVATRDARGPGLHRHEREQRLGRGPCAHAATLKLPSGRRAQLLVLPRVLGCRQLGSSQQRPNDELAFASLLASDFLSL